MSIVGWLPTFAAPGMDVGDAQIPDFANSRSLRHSTGMIGP